MRRRGTSYSPRSACRADGDRARDRRAPIRSCPRSSRSVRAPRPPWARAALPRRRCGETGRARTQDVFVDTARAGDVAAQFRHAATRRRTDAAHGRRQRAGRAVRVRRRTLGAPPWRVPEAERSARSEVIGGVTTSDYKANAALVQKVERAGPRRHVGGGRRMRRNGPHREEWAQHPQRDAIAPLGRVAIRRSARADPSCRWATACVRSVACACSTSPRACRPDQRPRSCRARRRRVAHQRRSPRQRPGVRDGHRPRQTRRVARPQCADDAATLRALVARSRRVLAGLPRRRARQRGFGPDASCGPTTRGSSP